METGFAILFGRDPRSDHYPDVGNEPRPLADGADPAAAAEPMTELPRPEAASERSGRTPVKGEPDEQEPESTAPTALKRIHDRLRDTGELVKLHLKHYHMSTANFRKRTTELQVPADIYELYDNVVRSCESCQRFAPAPVRSRISGMRATKFGDLWFVDHVEIGINEFLFVVLIVTDAMSNLLWAGPQKNKEYDETVSTLERCCAEWNISPKAVCGDQYFHNERIVKWYRYKNIKPIALGPHTPWPNRAEAAVKLFKHHAQILIDSIRRHQDQMPTVRHITVRMMFNRAAWARNIALTYGGKCPLEIAFGRRPPDALNIENMTPEQFSTEPARDERTEQWLKDEAIKAHLEARQRVDIRRDLAARLLPSHGPFVAGEGIWYWDRDMSKIRGGEWIRSRVIAYLRPPMVTIDYKGQPALVNQSKIRRNPDPWHDVVIPGVDGHDGVPTVPVDPSEREPSAIAGCVHSSNSSERIEVHAPTLWLYGKGKDLMQFCSDSDKLSAVVGLSHSVAEPVFMDKGFDYDDASRATSGVMAVRTVRPTVVWISPSHRMNTLMTSEFVWTIANEQMKNGGFFVLACDWNSELWSEPWMVHMSQWSSVHWQKICLDTYDDTTATGARTLCLMTNLQRGSLAPLKFGRQMTSEQCNHVCARTVSDDYPLAFCQNVFTYVADATRALRGLATEQPAISETEMRFMDDILGEYNVTELKQLKQSLMITETYGCNVVASTMEMASQRQEINVTNAEFKRFMVWLNSRPRGYSQVIDANTNWSNPRLFSILSNMRKCYFPHHKFVRCHLMRGIKAAIAPVLQGKGEQAAVLMWKKTTGPKRLSAAALEQVDWQRFNPEKWSILLFYTPDGTPNRPVQRTTVRADEPMSVDDNGGGGMGPPSRQMEIDDHGGGGLHVPPGPMDVEPVRQQPEYYGDPDDPLPPLRDERQRRGPREASRSRDPPSASERRRSQAPPSASERRRREPQGSRSRDHSPVDQDMTDRPADDLLRSRSRDTPRRGRNRQRFRSRSRDDDDSDARRRGRYRSRSRDDESDRVVSDDPATAAPQRGSPVYHRISSPTPERRTPASSSTDTPVAVKSNSQALLPPQLKAASRPAAKPKVKTETKTEVKREPVDTPVADNDSDDADALITTERDFCASCAILSINGDATCSVCRARDEYMQHGTHWTAAYHQHDLVVLEEDNFWKDQPDDHKMASMTASFSQVRDMDGHVITVDDLETTPLVSQALYLDNSWHQHAHLSEVQDDIQHLSPEEQQSLRHALRSTQSPSERACMPKAKAVTAPRRRMAARREATAEEKRSYAKQFVEAKLAEYKSWSEENDIYDMVDMRKQKVKNYITGRWVLTIKRDKDGNFLKCKARWVLRGFQDSQVWNLQTDSPTSTRPGFRLQCQLAANENYDITHIDLKTAFLQGEQFDEHRDIVCQLPPEAGLPPYMAARLKRAAYGLNDAPRLWWNRLDKALRSYGLIPTRADRCCYVLYSDAKSMARKADPSVWEAKAAFSEPLLLLGSENPLPGAWKTSERHAHQSNSDKAPERSEFDLEKALDLLLDPISGSKAHGRTVEGVVTIHVDDAMMTGTKKFTTQVIDALRREFKVGSEDLNDVMFVGQRVRWMHRDQPSKRFIQVDQEKKIEELSEVTFDTSLRDAIQCTPDLHRQYRSVLGQINWLQSRTQFQSCYAFSRCASAAAAPTIGDIRALNKLVRRIRAEVVMLRFWPLKGRCRLIGYPDAAYRNNADKSSQRGQTIFMGEPRRTNVKDVKGSLIDYESQKIKKTVLSTTVSELYAFMKCFGTCQFLRGLWMDISGTAAEVHMRTDANNLVTTASTTHLPEQKETIHMINQLRHEACSGSIDDLAHVVSVDCMADCLTKTSAKADPLVKSVESGTLPNVDKHPPFRELMKDRHKAYMTLAAWLVRNVPACADVCTFLAIPVHNEIRACLALTDWYTME